MMSTVADWLDPEASQVDPKRRILSACALVILAFISGTRVTQAETVWYQKEAVTAGSSAALTDLSFWVKGGEPGSGKPTSDDALIGYNGWRLRLAGATCPANSFQVGTSDTMCEVVHDAKDSSSAKASFANDGLKLVNGGWWFNAAKNFTIAGPVTVLSPKADAFAFFFGNRDHKNEIATISGSISGSSDVGLVFGKAGSWMSANGSTFDLSGDLSQYAGTLNVRADESVWSKAGGEQFGTRLRLHTTTTPCTVSVGKGCVLGACTVASTTTVARVNFETGTCYKPVLSDTAASCLRVTESLTLAGPVGVYVNGVLQGTGLYRLPILMAPALSTTFTEDDFKLEKGPDFCNLDLHLEVDIEPESGMRTLYLVTWGYLYKSGTGYSKEGQRDNPTPNVSSLTNAAYWSDKQVPHRDSAYCLQGKDLRTFFTPTEDYEFPGVSLWLRDDAKLMLSVKSFSVPTLYATGGSTLGVTQGSFPFGTTVMSERFELSDVVYMRAHADHALTLKGQVEGDADLEMAGWDQTSNPTAFYELEGMNTGFTGTILVTMDEYRPAYVSFESKFPTLYVNDGRNLGGRRPDFTPRALTLTHMARLSVSNSASVVLSDDVNCGVYVLEKGRFHAQRATSRLEVFQPVLLSGHLWTEGEGTVVLGGAMSFESSDGGAIVETPRAGSNLVTIASRKFVAGHPDCLNGCDVTVAANTQIIIDADKLGSTGVNLTRPGSAIHLDAAFGGKLPLSVESARPAPVKPEVPTIIGLVTVPDGEMVSTVRAMMPVRIPRVWANVAQDIVEIHDDERKLTTFALNVQSRGMMLIFR